MEWIDDPTAARWLEDFIADPDSLDSDEGNRDKNLKHGVSWEDIESVLFQEDFFFAGRIVEPSHAEWRGLILGRSQDGRSLALIFTRRGEKLRPISCRPMREGERKYYEARIKGQNTRQAG